MKNAYLPRNSTRQFMATVVIYDNLEINGPTGGSRSELEETPGPIKLQGHGNRL